MTETQHERAKRSGGVTSVRARLTCYHSPCWPAPCPSAGAPRGSCSACSPSPRCPHSTQRAYGARRLALLRRRPLPVAQPGGRWLRARVGRDLELRLGVLRHLPESTGASGGARVSPVERGTNARHLAEVHFPPSRLKALLRTPAPRARHVATPFATLLSLPALRLVRWRGACRAARRTNDARPTFGCFEGTRKHAAHFRADRARGAARERDSHGCWSVSHGHCSAARGC